jgi:hypothetical protein
LPTVKGTGKRRVQQTGRLARIDQGRARHRGKRPIPGISPGRLRQGPDRPRRQVRPWRGSIASIRSCGTGERGAGYAATLGICAQGYKQTRQNQRVGERPTHNFILPLIVSQGVFLTADCRLHAALPSLTMPASFFGHDPVQVLFSRAIPLGAKGEVAGLHCRGGIP